MKNHLHFMFVRCKRLIQIEAAQYLVVSVHAAIFVVHANGNNWNWNLIESMSWRKFRSFTHFVALTDCRSIEYELHQLVLLKWTISIETFVRFQTDDLWNENETIASYFRNIGEMYSNPHSGNKRGTNEWC